MESHYEVLGVSPDADHAEIRRAYRALLKEHHPDHGGSRERFLRIKAAYEAVTGETAPSGETDGDSLARSGAPTFAADARPTGPSGGPTVDGDYLSLTLAGLVHDLSLSSIVADGEMNADANRTVAFFEVENASDRVVPWRGRQNTGFIGDDGFMYEGSNIVAPHADALPTWWWARNVDVAPGEGLNAVVVAQTVPDDVTIETVVYTQHVYDESGDVADTERYLFEIGPGIRRALDHVPFDLE